MSIGLTIARRLAPLTTTSSNVEIKKRKYKVNIIEKVATKKGVHYILSIAKRTKSAIFLPPMLGGEKTLYFWNTLLLNCFIATEDDEDCISLLYRWSSDPKYLKFEQALTKFRFFRRRYDHDPKNKYSGFICLTDGEAPNPENCPKNALWVHSSVTNQINEDLTGMKIQLN